MQFKHMLWFQWEWKKGSVRNLTLDPPFLGGWAQVLSYEGNAFLNGLVLLMWEQACSNKVFGPLLSSLAQEVPHLILTHLSWTFQLLEQGTNSFFYRDLNFKGGREGWGGGKENSVSASVSRQYNNRQSTDFCWGPGRSLSSLLS